MIEIKNMTFGYSRKKLLYRDLSLSLGSGRIYGLLGRNGAGKSTLLKNMIGLLFPQSGSITVSDFKPGKRQPSFLQSIYFIPEEVYVPSLTIEKYSELFAPFYPRFDKAQFSRYLEELDVRTEEKLNKLSFGQQKKFIIAFSLACNTPVLLLDEPTNGLDIPSKKQFRKLIASVMNDERMIFISTHQIRDLDNLIDQIVIVDEGELLLNEPVAKITDRLVFRTVTDLSESTNPLYAEETLKGFAVVEQNHDAEDSKVNLEHLFNAVTENPKLIRQIFQQ